MGGRPKVGLFGSRNPDGCCKCSIHLPIAPHTARCINQPQPASRAGHVFTAPNGNTHGRSPRVLAPTLVQASCATALPVRYANLLPLPNAKKLWLKLHADAIGSICCLHDVLEKPLAAAGLPMIVSLMACRTGFIFYFLRVGLSFFLFFPLL